MAPLTHGPDSSSRIPERTWERSQQPDSEKERKRGHSRQARLCVQRQRLGCSFSYHIILQIFHRAFVLNVLWFGRGTLASRGTGIWEKHWRCFAVGADFLNAHKFCTLCIQPNTSQRHALKILLWILFNLCLCREHGRHLKNNHMASQTHSGMNEGLMGLTPRI